MPVSVQWVFCNVHKIVDVVAASSAAATTTTTADVAVVVVVIVVDNFIRHSDSKMWIFRASLILSPFTEHISISRNMSSLIPFTVIFMVVILLFFSFLKRCRKDLTSLKSEDFKFVSWICFQTLIALSRKCISADSFCRLLVVQREINFHLLQFLTETCVFQKLFLCVLSLNTCARQSSKNTVIFWLQTWLLLLLFPLLHFFFLSIYSNDFDHRKFKFIAIN